MLGACQLSTYVCVAKCLWSLTVIVVKQVGLCEGARGYVKQVEVM